MARVSFEGACFRALLLTVDGDSAEVLTASKPEKEMRVPMCDVKALEPFESTASCEDNDDNTNLQLRSFATVQRLKGEGKVLFGHRDFAAASEWYLKAIQALALLFPWRPQSDDEMMAEGGGGRSGACLFSAPVVVLLNTGGVIRAASIESVPRTSSSSSKAMVETVLVSFVDDIEAMKGWARKMKNNTTAAASSDGSDSDDDGGVVSVRCSDILAPVAPLTAQGGRALQCALYLNLARCYSNLAVVPSSSSSTPSSTPSSSSSSSPTMAAKRALWATTMAIRIAALPRSSSSSGVSPSGGDAVAAEEEESWDSTDSLSTGYYLRAKAHLLLAAARNASAATSAATTTTTTTAGSSNGGSGSGNSGGLSAKVLCRAQRDARRAEAAAGAPRREVSALLRDLAKKEKVLLKADRELARRIGEWTEEAMRKQQERKLEGCAPGEEALAELGEGGDGDETGLADGMM
jgi:hypothetical protein